MGVLVDLEDEMAVPLTELLTNGVPVYYPIPKPQPLMDLSPTIRELRGTPDSTPKSRYQRYARPDVPQDHYGDALGGSIGKRPLTE